MKKPDPSEVAGSLDHDIGEALEFCGRVLEEVNEHWAAHALWALNAGEVELAKKFLQLSDDVEKARELTPELRKVSEELLDEFRELDEDEEEESEENESGGEEE